MAAHFVICKYCGDRFDRDKTPFVEVGTRRYAHKACADKVEAAIPQDEKDYNTLEEYIKHLFKADKINAKTKKQIRDFRQEYGYTYTGILKTLYWWYEIKGHTTELAKDGIGIVPYVYEDAEKYYYTLFVASKINEQVQDYKPKIVEVEIQSPEVQSNTIRLFKI